MDSHTQTRPQVPGASHNQETWLGKAFTTPVKKLVFGLFVIYLGFMLLAPSIVGLIVAIPVNVVLSLTILGIVLCQAVTTLVFKLAPKNKYVDCRRFGDLSDILTNNAVFLLMLLCLPWLPFVGLRRVAILTAPVVATLAFQALDLLNKAYTTLSGHSGFTSSSFAKIAAEGSNKFLLFDTLRNTCSFFNINHEHFKRAQRDPVASASL
jgi:hypothetical protein